MKNISLIAFISLITTSINAQYFSEKGFGIMLEEKDLNKGLFNLLESIHNDKSMLKSIEANQKKHSDKNVFVIIGKEITKLFYEN